jgi:hypothetical protein
MAKAEVVEETTNEVVPTDAFEVELPEDMSAADLERAINVHEDKPKTEPKAEDKSKPAETKTEVVDPTATQTATNKGPAKEVANERKIKDLKAENKRLRDQWAAIEQERNVGRSKLHNQPIKPVEVRVAKPATKQVVETAHAQEAKGESSAAVLAEGVTTQMYEVTQAALKDLVGQINTQNLQRMERELAEDLLEDTGENFYEMLQKAGIYDAVKVDAQGNFADPVIAEKIYSKANPAKAALRLARAKLATLEPEEKSTDTTEEVEPTKPQVTAKATEKAATKDEVAAARRDGAREVVETMAASAAKPRGIRVFTGAGNDAPKVGRSPEFWDSLNRMMDKNPEGFLRVMDKNPEISTWFDNGRPKS